ncbi:MAG TPA: cytochrome c biogenesis protein CcsA [candidate division Zixibacteria bacterium]|nr:cytochrome c biogenesis protein CcsA [candidate division Zixibacteria bacterium]
MQPIYLLWLRVAAVLYGLGFIYVLSQLRSKNAPLSRFAVPTVGLGLVFHFVSIVETTYFNGYQHLLDIRHAESALALLIMIIFMGVFVRYRTTSPGVFVLPLVFFLTVASAVFQRPADMSSSPMLRSGWIFFHVSTLLIGYAALFLSFVSSILYIFQARSLKAKVQPGWLSKLPALQVTDELGYKALLIGFPFMTVGLIAGMIFASEKFGASYFGDPKVVLSLLMWGVYMLLIYTRWSAGWRGRKAAYLATFAFAAAVCAWAANYLSRVHRFVAP